MRGPSTLLLQRIKEGAGQSKLQPVERWPDTWLGVPWSLRLCWHCPVPYRLPLFRRNHTAIATHMRGQRRRWARQI
jgi:hypothetical protein